MVQLLRKKELGNRGNFKKYYGIFLFAAVMLGLFYIGYNFLPQKYNEYITTKQDITTKENELSEVKNRLRIVQNKIAKIKNSISGSQKKIYSPLESDLGNDSLFFTLYSDLIEIVKSNSVKIKAINYEYNPETDNFVSFGKDVYFVCDVNMELISNYVNLGNLIQDIHQYPYYIKINSIEVLPFEKDKTVLLSKINLRLYARTSPEEDKDGNKD